MLVSFVDRDEKGGPSSETDLIVCGFIIYIYHLHFLRFHRYTKYYSSTSVEKLSTLLAVAVEVFFKHVMCGNVENITCGKLYLL